ncbi:MAG: M16 family metallopeptidase [Chloroflexia bacterium]
MTETTTLAAPAAEAPAAAFERRVLPNGLTVLTREMHAAPVVTFWIWYRVGARNEHLGITGVSHWVEHMLFKGTPTFPAGSIHRVVAENGGTLNGFTSDDYTTYFETLPSDRWELGLQIEADRIRNASFKPEEVAGERTVIISEREGHENDPDFKLNEEVQSAAFKIHPYGVDVIGWKCDLLAMTRDDLYNHYRTYYAPNNAVIVAVGDFETPYLIERVTAMFGDLEPSGAIPPVTAVEPQQEGERRVVVRRPGPTAQLQMAYHTPAATDPDVYPLMIADALLSGAKAMGMGGGMGRSARLYRSLVQTDIAAAAGSYFRLTRDPGLFQFAATARPGKPPEVALREMEDAILRELDRLSNELPSPQELEKAITQTRAQFVYSAEGVSGLGYIFGWLEAIATADLYTQFLDRYSAVTPEECRRVARTYFRPDNRTVGWFVPTEEAALG